MAELIERRELRARLALDLADARLAPAAWSSLFEHDLWELWRWSIRRIDHAARSPVDLRAPPSDVLALLPRTAPVAHLLRRAVPFAACEIPTLCSFPTAVVAEGLVKRVASALGIERSMVSTSTSPETLVEGMPASTTIVLTGRRATARQVRRRARGRFVGATGRCAVLLGSDPGLLQRAWVALRSHVLPASCSRPRWCALWSEGSEAAARLRQDIRRLHPSVILFVSADGQSVPRGDLMGYSVIACALDGSSPGTRGFARDPLFGWPGDHML